MNRGILKIKNKRKGLIPPVILNVPKIYFILTYSGKLLNQYKLFKYIIYFTLCYGIFACFLWKLDFWK